MNRPDYRIVSRRRGVATWRSRVALAAALLVVLTVVGGGISVAAQGPTAPTPSGNVASTSATTSTTTVPLSPAMAQWKQRYLYVIGHVAGDVLVVVTDGTKGSKHPTKARAKQVLTDCRTWEKDSHKAAGKAPPIPSATAQADWKHLLSSSEAASSDCITAYKTGSKKAAKRFRTQLVVVHRSESQLTAIFSG
jgi:hypothetical protein